MRALRVVASVVVLLVGASVSASAQDAAFFAKLSPGTPVDGRPGCTWQWSQHSAVIPGWGGWYHQCGTPTAPSIPGVALPAACVPWPDAYAEGDRMQACAAALAEQNPPQPAERPTYRAGARYHYLYPSQRMMVIVVTVGFDAAEIVACQWLTNDPGIHRIGDVFAFRSDDEAQRWFPVP